MLVFLSQGSTVEHLHSRLYKSKNTVTYLFHPFLPLIRICWHLRRSRIRSKSLLNHAMSLNLTCGERSLVTLKLVEWEICQHYFLIVACEAVEENLPCAVDSFFPRHLTSPRGFGFLNICRSFTRFSSRGSPQILSSTRFDMVDSIVFRC